jgi:membrane-anchored glycerophosphoryl diester phosphodiesterase (GDPDase)
MKGCAWIFFVSHHLSSLVCYSFEMEIMDQQGVSSSLSNEVRRRLSSTPAYSDFLIIFFLCIALIGLLKGLLVVSDAWKQ